MAEFVETGPEHDRCVLKLVGDIDVTATDELVAAARRCLDQATDVELDLGEMTFIDSSGLGALVRIRIEATEQAKNLSLTNVTERTTRLLRITGLDRSFSIHPQQS